MEWAQAAAVIGAMTAVIGTVVGLQSVWIARTFDVLRDEMHRGFDRLEARIERVEGRGPPGLRRI